MKLYYVSTDDEYYQFLCKANNKKEAINLIYNDFGLAEEGYYKKEVEACVIDDSYFDGSQYVMI